jgi:MinD superfamily P-loop ATPase
LLITGFAEPGVGKTGLVVTDYVVAKTKEFVLKLTRQFKPDKIIFDTAAGTHCPVITGIMNSDFAYAVTEPTPMGAHDLRLILDLCQKLKVPAKIVLNQADLGNRQKVEQISQKFKSKIEIEIPYSKKIAQAYSAGKLKEIDLLK